jgi:hypothetical protein
MFNIAERYYYVHKSSRFKQKSSRSNTPTVSVVRRCHVAHGDSWWCDKMHEMCKEYKASTCRQLRDTTGQCSFVRSFIHLRTSWIRIIWSKRWGNSPRASMWCLKVVFHDWFCDELAQGYRMIATRCKTWAFTLKTWRSQNTFFISPYGNITLFVWYLNTHLRTLHVRK